MKTLMMALIVATGGGMLLTAAGPAWGQADMTTATVTAADAPTTPAIAKTNGEPAETDNEPESAVMRLLKDWRVYAAAVVLVVIVAALLMFFGGSARKGGDTPSQVELDDERISLLERMRAELSVLHRKIIEGDHKDLHEKGAKWCKTVLAGATDQTARNATLPELRQRFGQGNEITAEFRQELFSLLERAEKVKLARYVPSKEEQQTFYHDCQGLLEHLSRQLANRPPEPEPQTPNAR